MAVTVEELQIVLGVDATTAEKALIEIEKRIDSAISKMGTIGRSSAARNPFTNVTKQEEEAQRKINGIFSKPQKFGSLRDLFRGFKQGFKDIWDENQDWIKPALGENTGPIRAADAIAAEKAAAQTPSARTEEAAGGIRQTGEEADRATPKIERYNAALSNGGRRGKFFSSVFGHIGKSIHKSNGFLSRFGQTLKRVIMRMMAMGLVRGVIKGFTEGMKLLANASEQAKTQFGKFTTLGNSVKAALGSVALSVLNALSGVLYNIASAAVTAANAVARFFGALGDGTYYAVKMADSFDDMESSASGAGSAAKGMLAKFDELNVIGNKGGGGGSGSGLGNTTAGLEKAESVLATLLQKGLFEEAGNYVAGLLDDTVLKIDNFFLELDQKNYGGKFAQFLNGLFGNKKLWKDAGKTVGDGINTVTNAIYNFFTTFDGNKIGTSFSDALSEAFRTTDWKHIGETIWAGLDVSLDTVGSFLANFDWLTTINAVTKTIVGLIEEKIKNPITLIRLVGNLVITLARIAEGIIVSSITGLLYATAGVLEPWFPKASQKITEWADGIEKWVEDDADRAAQEFNDACDKMENGLDSVKTKSKTALGQIGTSFNNAGIAASNATSKVAGLKSSIDKLSGKTITITTVYETRTSSSGVQHSGNAGKFASGGIVYGDTLANVGEYANARTNPEVIAPLSDLAGILSRVGVGGNSEGVRQQNELLAEQNRLLRVIANKELTVSPSAALGQVVAKSNALYARA